MEEKDKVLFLDFDGVLNTEYYQRLLCYEGRAWQDKHGAFFDPEAVGQLKRIVEATHADIVIESSWKYLGLEAMREMWAARRLPGEVVDITPSSVSDGWLLSASADDMSEHCKGAEIASWLFDHADDDTRYVILDDEYVILDSQLPRFVMTNPYDGITEDIADRTIALLNG